MNKLTEAEKLQLKGRLLTVIEKWLNKETEVDNNIGYLPENIEVMMTNQAFSILEATNAMNHFFYQENMISQ